VCDFQQYCWKKMVVVGGAGAGGVKKSCVTQIFPLPSEKKVKK